MALVKEVLLMTGWRAFAPKTGLFVGQTISKRWQRSPEKGHSTERLLRSPLLKPPVWTWEIPAHSSSVARPARRQSSAQSRVARDPALVRDARWLAAVGGAVSPALLVSDLGRPERFLNMLRVSSCAA